jgi:hypothetical protein
LPSWTERDSVRDLIVQERNTAIRDTGWHFPAFDNRFAPRIG